MTKKSIRAVAATTMMALALSFGAGSAFAEPSQGQDGTVVNGSATGLANIDYFQKGSIEIFKKLNPETYGKAATGDKLTDVSGTPLNGVKFTAKKLSAYDLSKQEDWLKLAKLVPGGGGLTLTT